MSPPPREPRRSNRQPKQRTFFGDDSPNTSPAAAERCSSQHATTATNNAAAPGLSQHSHQSRVSFAETPTVIGSQSTTHSLSIATDGGDRQQSSSESQPPPEEEECEILPLAERLPKIEDVIAGLKTHHNVLSIISTPGVLISDEHRDWFINVYFEYKQYDEEDFWNVAWESMYDAMLDNTPESQSQVKSCKDGYLYDIKILVNSHFSERPIPAFDGTIPDDFMEKLSCLSNCIGWVFVEYFERLITMPRGREVVPIATQLDECLENITFKDPAEFFDDGLDKAVYYCAGYLCHAGQTAAARRNTTAGKCIGAISTHFATNEEDAEKVKRNLPVGLASLVDSRAVHGCLSYPDIRFYCLIAKIEYCYYKLATPNNLMIFGGNVLSTICNAMIEHEVLSEHFATLYDDSSMFDRETIDDAFAFYVKVYSNLRLKDLCRKYNSQLHKTNTVGLRQQLAHGGTLRTKSKKGRKRKKPEQLVESEAEIHSAMEEIAEAGVSTGDDESEQDTDS